MMNAITEFENEKKARIASYQNDQKVQSIAKDFIIQSCYNQYTYNFSWMGRPIIQFPQDMVIMQELIWELQPDLIIETGIAHGGSLVFYASILQLIGKGRVIGVDIDIRKHNRVAIEKHPMFHRIHLIEGSSIDLSTIEKVRSEINDAKKVMVCLDSFHTHEHVLAELNAYYEFVSVENYLVVFDTTAQILEEKVLTDISKESKIYKNTLWGKNHNPHTALKSFLENHKEFVIEPSWHQKALITNCFEGFLKKIK